MAKPDLKVGLAEANHPRQPQLPQAKHPVASLAAKGLI
jgi:hypothetical protein